MFRDPWVRETENQRQTNLPALVMRNLDQGTAFELFQEVNSDAPGHPQVGGLTPGQSDLAQPQYLVSYAKLNLVS